MGHYSVNNQAWQAFDSVSFQTAEELKAQKQGEVLIAHSHGVTKNLLTAKDVHVAASHAQLEEEFAYKKAQRALRLPHPWKTFGGQDKNDIGLIAILSAAIIAQEKTNSTIWSVLWRQATESMLQQVRFAPIIANAIVASANAQSNATMQDADQAWADGWVDIGSFGASVLGGAFAEYENPEFGDLTKPNTNVAKQETESAMEEEGAAGSKNLDPDSQLSKDLDEDIAKEEEGESTNKAMREWKTRAKGKLAASKRVLGFLAKVSQYSMMTHPLSEGTKALINNGYMTKKAGFQLDQGVAEALSKEAEQLAGFFQSDFSRTDSLTNTTQQYFEFGANLYKSAADTVTQTVTSMFRS